jgi:hypothetical protein
MNRFRILAVTCAAFTAALAGGTARLHASNPVAVYARIDRVVLAPDAKTPDTIQIFGVFSVAVPANGNDYQPAARGYLYLKLSGNEQLARREWADLKSVAGTGQIVAFGMRYQFKPRLRKATEPPDAPDPYISTMGVTKVSGNTDYAPIRSLVDFRD